MSKLPIELSIELNDITKGSIHNKNRLSKVPIILKSP